MIEFRRLRPGEAVVTFQTNILTKTFLMQTAEIIHSCIAGEAPDRISKNHNRQNDKIIKM